MKILVISDSHGNISNLKHVLGFAKKIRCGAVIHCGDWNNLESVNTVINFNIPLYGVIGNADIADNIKYKFKKIEEIEIDNKKIGIIHNIRNLKVNKNNFDIIFCGHNHKQLQIGNIVNPGALENDIHFAIYDTLTNTVEFING
jgi:putative phosphoesterase